MCNSLIFKPLGGGVKVSTSTAIFRAKRFVDTKISKNRKYLQADYRSLLLHVLQSRFGASVDEMIEAFPWSRATIFRALAVGKWLEENHNTKTIQKRITEITDYIIYYNRYT